jgi:hypothetical protein
MKYINGDVLFLTADLCGRKMPRVIGAWCDKEGRNLSEAQYLTLQGGVTLHRRFLGGNYSANEDEVKSLFAACQCINDLHAEAEGHPKKELTMPVSAAFSANGPLPPPRGAYDSIMESIGGGILEGFEAES